MKGIILAAGLGTRLRPLTDNCPKALLPVAGTPMLWQWLSKMYSAGVDEIVINAYHLAHRIVEYVESVRQDFNGLRISVSDERPALLNTGGGISRAMSMLPGNDNDEEMVIIANADILTDFNVAEILGKHDGDVRLLVDAERATRRKLLFDDKGYMKGWRDSGSGTIKTPFTSLPSPLRECAFNGIHCMKRSLGRYLEEYSRKDECFSIIDFYIDNCDKLDIRSFVPAEKYSWTDIGKLDVYNSLPH